MSLGMLAVVGPPAQQYHEEDRIVLSGDVDVIQADGNLLRADRFTYLLEDGRPLQVPPWSAVPVNGPSARSAFADAAPASNPVAP